MSLMDRIKLKNFLQYSLDEQHSFISKLQLLRSDSLEAARTKAGRVTRTAKVNLQRKGKKVFDPEEKLLKILAKNPHLIEKIESLL